MSAFEHVAVFLSIVVGVAVTQLLAHVQGLLAARHRVRGYWLAWLWAGLIFLTLVAWWWGAFELRTATAWNFFYFLLVLLSPVLLYLAAAFVLPTVEPGETIDLRAHYWRMHRWVFGLLAGSLLLDVARRVVVGVSLSDPGVVSNLIGVGGVAVLAISTRPAVHLVLSLGCVTALLWFVVTAALRLA